MSSITFHQASAHRVTVPLSRSLQVAGAFYAVFGIAALGKLAESSVGFGLPAAILLAFVLFGLGMVLYVRNLTVENGQYSLTTGFWPVVRRVEGSVSDASAVRVLRLEPSQLGEQDTARVLVIEWADDRPSLEVLRGSSSDRRFDDRASDIAAAFGLLVSR